MRSLLRIGLPTLLLLVVVSTVRADYCTNNAMWLAMGEGLPGVALASAEFKGLLYVVHQDRGSMAMSAWDGKAWTRVSSFPVSALEYENFRLTPFNGDLYLTGPFTRVDGLPATENIARWDGTAWSSVGGGTSGPIRAVTVYNGELYVAGQLKMAGSLKIGTIARFDGESWAPLGEGVEGVVTDLAVHEDRLFVLGDLGNVEGDKLRNIAIWDGEKWSAGDSKLEFATPARMTVYRDKLYLFGAIGMPGRVAKMAVYEKSGWKELVVPDSIPVENADLAGLDLLYLHRPNKRALSYGGIWTWDGATWGRISEFDNEVTSQRIIGYRGRAHAYGNFTSSCGTELRFIAMLCTDRNCSFISGSVYQDMDGDCARDGDEPGIAGRVVEILPGPIYAVSGQDGAYRRAIPELGNYSVSIVPFKYWYPTCGVSARQVVLDQPGTVVGNLDLSVRPIPGIYDLSASISGAQARPGFPVTYTIRYENVGTEPVSGTIRLEYDTLLHYDSSRVTHTRHRRGLIEWDFAKLPVGVAGSIRVYMTVSSTAALGTQLCVRLAIDRDDGYEETLRDNRDSLCDNVTGSYDPNDISVSPLGSLEEDELYRLGSGDTVLSYMIRFQNTGTDTAFTVVVMDTLDLARLNMTTITMGASSHPYDLDIAPDGALRFTFNNILLPDSNVNEIASHGYLKYSVNLQRGLSPSTEIANRAAIYFDYNDPVITNTVVSATQGTGISSAPYDPDGHARATIYPNPANGRIYVAAEMERGGVITLSTLLGREAGRWVSDGSGRTTLDLSAIPAGVYLLRVETESGVAMRRLSIVR